MNFPNKNINIETVLNRLGMASIFGVSIGYFLYRQGFAEKHISFSFLDFPIFVGEQLFFVCLILCCLKFFLVKQKNFTRKEKITAVFFGLVLLKAAVGYFTFGPLALRHAGLYNYLLFIYFGYSFFNPKDHQNKFLQLILFLGLILILYNGVYYRDWFLAFVCFALILIKQFSDIKVKLGLLAFLVVMTPWHHAFTGSRMLMLGNLCSILFIVVSLNLMFSKKTVSFLLGGVLLGLTLFGYMTMSDKVELKSMVSFDLLFEKYKYYDTYIEEKSESFNMDDQREVKLYNPTSIDDIKQRHVDKVDLSQEREASVQTKALLNKINTHQTQIGASSNTQDVYVVEQMQENVKKSIQKKKKVKGEKTPEERLSVTMNNFLFRVFIWRDMLREMIEHKPVFGFHFGKPLRSKSLEATNWAQGEWGRDGWIAAHNSFFHIIYRTGVLGFILIGWLIFKLWQFTVFFIKNKSLTGVLLCAIIFGWFVKANFLLGFEFPYSAIPLWAIFGITYKYYEQLQSVQTEKVKQ